jgi:non-heme chloroperoxidase
MGHHYIAVENSVKIFVEDIGQGQPVIFLHGWPLNHEMFEFQKNELPRHGYRFIGVDFRGYGKSDRPAGGYDYNTMADDLHHVIKELGLCNAVLAGFSMGGAIALRYMSRYQGYGVSKLMLLSPAAPVFTQRADYPYGMKVEDVDDLIRQIETDSTQAMEGFGKMFFNKRPSAETKGWFTHMAMTASTHGTIQSALALRDEDLRSELSSVTVPTLIVHGTKDEICPFEFAEYLSKHLPRVQLLPCEESGHGVFHDEEEKFNQALLDFLSYSVTMPITFTVENALQAKRKVEELEMQGHSRDSIYHFAHSKERQGNISEMLETEQVTMEEKGFFQSMKNAFSNRGDKLRSDLQAAGLSDSDLAAAELELDKGKLLLVVNES